MISVPCSNIRKIFFFSEWKLTQRTITGQYMESERLWNTHF